MFDVVILGSGPAGCTAGIYAARANLKTLIVHGDEPGGQLTTTTDVENFPAFVKIQGPELMDKMIEHAKYYGCEVKTTRVKEIKKEGDIFHIQAGRELVTSKTVILCTGASAKWLGLESETKFKNFGVSACATCDGFFFKNKDVAVIGGGNTALTEALYLANITNKVYLIHRRGEFRGEKILHERVKNNPKIELVLNSETQEICGEDNPKKVTHIKVKNKIDNSIREIPLNGVFIAIGHKPNSDIVKGLVDIDEEGYVITKPGTPLTSLSGMFAAGDIQDKVYKQAITSAGKGCEAAMEAESYIGNLGL